MRKKKIKGGGRNDDKLIASVMSIVIVLILLLGGTYYLKKEDQNSKFRLSNLTESPQEKLDISDPTKGIDSAISNLKDKIKKEGLEKNYSIFKENDRHKLCISQHRNTRCTSGRNIANKIDTIKSLLADTGLKLNFADSITNATTEEDLINQNIVTGDGPRKGSPIEYPIEGGPYEGVDTKGYGKGTILNRENPNGYYGARLYRKEELRKCAGSGTDEGNNPFSFFGNLNPVSTNCKKCCLELDLNK